MKKKTKKSSGDKLRAERIWRIRDSIQKLEDIKDKIIDFLKDDAETYDIAWITDAKEFYYNIVSAWEMLRAASEGKEKYIATADAFLTNAKSRCAQSSSELRILGRLGKIIDSRLQEVFTECWTAINTELDLLKPEDQPKPPAQRVIKESDTEYHLPCSVCGEIAVSFILGISESSKKKYFACVGIVHGGGLPISTAKKIFAWLDQENIAQIHTHLMNSSVIFEEGIDAYCPKCDKIYCNRHYDTREEWDEGFYDCTYGTCPEGHTNHIHD